MRGFESMVGDHRIAPNGYHYTRTLDGWRLSHHVIMEKKLGRKIDTDRETVRFKDRDRNNLDPDNIVIASKRERSPERRMAELKAKIEQLQGELDDLEQEA